MNIHKPKHRARSADAGALPSKEPHLLHRDKRGEPADDRQVHDAAHEQQQHQCPAAPQAVEAVLEPHPKRAPPAIAPSTIRNPREIDTPSGTSP